MINTVGFAGTCAALLAMVSAMFGVGIARVWWAEDLKHVQQLRISWDKQRGFMESTIEAQQRTIKILESRIPK